MASLTRAAGCDALLWCCIISAAAERPSASWAKIGGDGVMYGSGEYSSGLPALRPIVCDDSLDSPIEVWMGGSTVAGEVPDSDTGASWKTERSLCMARLAARCWRDEVELLRRVRGIANWGGASRSGDFSAPEPWGWNTGTFAREAISS